MFFSPDLDCVCDIQCQRDLQHWSPQSEDYASTNHLTSALLQRWQVNNLVIYRTHRFSGGRNTNVYYFELRRGGEYMTMPVVETPPLKRLIMTQPFDLVAYQEERFTVLPKHTPQVEATAS